MDASTLKNCQRRLKAYTPPEWAAELDGIPSHMVQLAQCNTPIEKWNLPGIPEDFEVYIKRDDLTGSVVSGNKVRKLDFLMADAIRQGCTSIITVGGIQSNCCRAAAICARTLGLQIHLLIITDKDPDSAQYDGNYLLDHLMGAHCYFIPSNSRLNEDIWPRMKQLADKIWKETGEKAYPMPIGGSTAVGMFGYINAFHEMESQGLFTDNFTDVVIAMASGASGGGLAVSNHLTGSKLKIHGPVTLDKPEHHHREINMMFRDLNLLNADGTKAQSEDLISLYGEALGKGYGISTDDEIDFISDVARQTGIVLGSVYAGKAAYHMVKQMNNHPEIFKGKKILFVHTGGMFDLFSGSVKDYLSRTHATRNIHVWNELTDEAPFTQEPGINNNIPNGLTNGHL